MKICEKEIIKALEENYQLIQYFVFILLDNQGKEWACGQWDSGPVREWEVGNDKWTSDQMEKQTMHAQMSI